MHHKLFSTKEKFSKAAKYFLRAEDLGDPTARKGFLGLANTLKNLPKRQRKIQAQKLSQVYQQDAERGGTQSFMIRAEVYAIEKDDGKAMDSSHHACSFTLYAFYALELQQGVPIMPTEICR